MMMKFPEQLSAATPEQYRQAALENGWMTALKQAGLFKMFVPRQLGGLELRLEDALRLLIKSATHHGSLGWIHNLAAGANFFCGYFEEETAAEIFGAPEVLCSGSGAPTGRIRRTGEGFTASGTWNFCSGAGYATHFTATALDEQEQPVTFICDAAGVEVSGHWRAFGLKASSTRQIVMTKQPVPFRYQFEIGRQNSFFEYPIYRIDFETFARLCLSATWQGIAEGFLRHLEDDLSRADAEISRRIAHIRELLSALENRRRAFSTALHEADYQPADPQAFRKRVASTLSAGHRDIYREAGELCWQLGLLITDEGTCSHWAWRDLQTASQHFFVK